MCPTVHISSPLLAFLTTLDFCHLGSNKSNRYDLKLTLFLFSISLTIRNADHILNIYPSFLYNLERCFLISFGHFKIGLYLFLLLNSFAIREKNHGNVFSVFIVLESYNVVPQGTICGLKVIHISGLVVFDNQSEMTELFAF